MHPEIEKLIAIAKDSGNLTERQREILLRKAEELGENVDEVEFVLEKIRLSLQQAKHLKPDENVSNEGNVIPDTEEHVVQAETPLAFPQAVQEPKKKTESLSIKGCLNGCLIFLLGAGIIVGIVSIALRLFGGSINDENMRESVMQDDVAEVEQTEEQNAVPVNEEIVENAEMQNTNAVTVFKEIMEYIRNEDFQGARAKAGNNQELLDEIAANEVNWYIIQGALENAKKAAATVHDERKKEKLLKDIWEHEFNQ